MRTAFKGKYKIQDHWEDTIYHIEGQTYIRLPVFKITTVEGAGKVKIIHQSFLHPFGGNIERHPEDEGH